MWYPPKVTTPPANEPVSLAEAKAQCGVSGNDSDAALNIQISAARSFVEAYCGIHIVGQTVEVTCDGFADFCRLPIAPVLTLTAITYVDTAGDPQTLSTDVYQLRDDGLRPRIELKYGQQWPAVRSRNRIKVTATVGYATVPADLKAALLLTISKMFAMSGRDVGVRSETVEGLGSTQWGGIEQVTEQLDNATRSLLENYRTWPL